MQLMYAQKIKEIESFNLYCIKGMNQSFILVQRVNKRWYGLLFQLLGFSTSGQFLLLKGI